MALASSYRNHLLNMLSSQDRERLEPHLHRVPLEARMLIEPAGSSYEYVYFIEHGVVSVIAKAGGKTVEIGIVGREGMTGLAVLLGSDHAVNESVVQVRGDAWRISAPEFRRMLVENPTLHAALLRYVQAFMVQTAQTALANTKSRLEERLARWLLMVHDRDGGKRVEITHEFMATMLGTRRAGVTVALHELEGKGLIRTRRGSIIIADREGLEEFAGVFYGQPEAEYRRIMGSSWRKQQELSASAQ